MPDIVIPAFKPRAYQLPFLSAMDDGCKRAVLVWHRRAGKEMACWNWLIKQALWHRVGTYVYFFPTTKLGRRILWNGRDRDGKAFLDYIPKEIRAGEPNKTELTIPLINGSVIQIIGTDNITNVGTNQIGCIFSEYSLQDENAWNYVRPILRENGGWSIFNFTPRGKNHAFELYNMAKHNPDWFCQLLTINDTLREDGRRIVTDEDVDEERRSGMSEDMIKQEFYCSFEQGTEGSYYAKYLNRSEIDGRITSVPHDPHACVDTYWDIGVGDETVILFAQNCGQEVHLIDMYRNQGEGIQHYARILKEKAERNSWNYGNHFAPHDIKVKEFGNSAKTRLEVARTLGIPFQIVDNIPISEGIELARALFSRLWIDENNCAFFLKAIENYQKTYNETHNVYSDSPLHNWSSHTADAFRYLAVAQSIKQSRGTMSESEAEAMQRAYALRLYS